MRVPLEILRLILDHHIDVCNHWSEPCRVWDLRLVNVLFDQEVLDRIFSHRRPPNALPAKHVSSRIQQKHWPSMPRTLRHKYLMFRIAQLYKQPGLFSHLCIPVFERELARLNVTEAKRDTYISAWCELSMHHHFNLGWVLINRWKEPYSAGASYSWYVTMMPELQVHCGEEKETKETTKLLTEKGTENNQKYLHILCAILRDDQEAVLDAFAGTCIAVDEQNLCFGGTLLAFAIEHGSITMLILLLQSVKRVNRKHLHIYLHLALVRSADYQAYISVLLDRLTGSGAARTDPIATLLVDAMNDSKVMLFDTIFHWMINTRDMPLSEKLHVVNKCFYHAQTVDQRHWGRNTPPPLGYTNHTKKFLAYPAPAHREEVLHILSPSTYPLNESKGDSRFNRVHNDTMAFYLSSPDFSREANRPIYHAVAMGLLHWVDWMLWAGADPRHGSEEIGLLGHAWKAGVRDEVRGILERWGWDWGMLVLEECVWAEDWEQGWKWVKKVQSCHDCVEGAPV